MATLISYDKEIDSIFQLFGNKENDITHSLSWVMTQCPVFTQMLVHSVTKSAIAFDQATIRNQAYDAETGITDIELTDAKTMHIIFEAKRGWLLPKEDQLTRYSLRKDFVQSTVTHKYIVTVSECSNDYAQVYLPFHSVNGIPVVHLPYRQIYEMTLEAKADSNHQQKHLLVQFADYLKGIMTMQNQDSNMVYVVSLSSEKPEDCEITWIEIVEKNNKYCCPIGGQWPKSPPNYIAFRYEGQLKAIHHIDNYIVSRNLHDGIPQMPDKDWGYDHYIYTLGAKITPSHVVKTGQLFRNGRVWAMLDLLLTCSTISEARDKTKERIG